MIFYKIEPKPHLKLRIIATLIDYGIFFIIIFLYGSVFGQKTDDGWVLNGLPALPIPIFWVLYFVLTEKIIQATPGHDICKLKAVTTDGYKLTFATAFKRRICDPIDILFYGIPAVIAILKSPKHQRLGDMLAGTVVVKKSDITEITSSFKSDDHLTNI
jgi:uncharacterized RDD family membrane protein YckC